MVAGSTDIPQTASTAISAFDTAGPWLLPPISVGMSLSVGAIVRSLWLGARVVRIGATDAMPVAHHALAVVTGQPDPWFGQAFHLLVDRALVMLDHVSPIVNRRVRSLGNHPLIARRLLSVSVGLGGRIHHYHAGLPSTDKAL